MALRDENVYKLGFVRHISHLSINLKSKFDL